MNQLAENVKLLLLIVIFMMSIHLLNYSLDYQLLLLGVLPREIESLPFVPVMPLLHASTVHLSSNMVGILVFGGLILLRSRKLFVQGSVFIIVVGGLMVWTFGRANIHVGASGWVFGLWSLLIALGFYRRRLSDLLIAIFVLVFYGGMAWGILPTNPLVSFESHLFGAVAGALYVVLPWRREQRLR